VATLDDLLKELELSIASAEMLTASYTAALMQMNAAGDDTTEAELRLWRHVEALSEMRLRRLKLREEQIGSRTRPPATGI
jgi:hypothetical protein